jgi:hypothetical protein
MSPAMARATCSAGRCRNECTHAGDQHATMKESIYMRIPKLSILLVALLGAVAPAYAQSAFPLNMPARTVYGNPLGGDGLASAIPYANLIAGLGAVPYSRNVYTSAPLAGGGSLLADLTLSLNANGINNTLIRQSGPLALIGRSANSTGNVADIAAIAASSCVYRENASSLACGSINLAASGAVGSSILGIANGGSGQATQAAALSALMPTPTRAGDLVYWNGSNWIAFAGNNSGTQFLTENASGVPAWATVSGTGTVTSVVCFGVAITSSGTCATAATKSDEQTGSSPTAVVTPLHQQDHDSAAKAWVYFGSVGTVSSSYNVSTVTHSGTGAYNINFSPTVFATSSFACTASANGNAFAYINSKSASTVQIVTRDNAGSTQDVGADVVCYGRQ